MQAVGKRRDSKTNSAFIVARRWIAAVGRTQLGGESNLATTPDTGRVRDKIQRGSQYAGLANNKAILG